MTTRTKDAAGFVIFDEHDRVLLVHQTYGNKKWGIPGGQQFEGESAWETAIRECREEINVEFKAADFSLSGMYFLPHRNAYVFIFKIINWSGSPKPDDEEIDEARFFAIDQLPSPMSNFTVQRIRDAAMNHPAAVLREQHVRDYVIGDVSS